MKSSEWLWDVPGVDAAVASSTQAQPWPKEPQNLFTKNVFKRLQYKHFKQDLLEFTL